MKRFAKQLPDRRDRQGAGGAAAEHGLLDQFAGVVGADMLQAPRQACSSRLANTEHFQASLF
jgi:hypothetical protein